MRIFALLVSLTALPSAHACDVLSVANGYVPEAPPTAKVMTAYMKFINAHDQSIKIESIESPQFGRIEMHTSIEENGIASMKALPYIEVDDTFTLQPGGAHLMLFNPTQPLRAGDEVEFTFNMNDNTTHKETLSVEKRKVNTHTQHQSHDNHHDHHHHH